MLLYDSLHYKKRLLLWESIILNEYQTTHKCWTHPCTENEIGIQNLGLIHTRSHFSLKCVMNDSHWLDIATDIRRYTHKRAVNLHNITILSVSLLFAYNYVWAYITTFTTFFSAKINCPSGLWFIIWMFYIFEGFVVYQLYTLLPNRSDRVEV